MAYRNEQVGRRVMQAAAPLFGVALVLVLLASVARWTAPVARRSVTVGVPQINATETYYQSRIFAPEIARDFDERFASLLRELRDVDLLVFPEAYDGRYSLSLAPLVRRWSAYAREHQQAILFSSYLVEPDGFKSNAIGGFSAEGTPVGVHRKVDLAPIGENALAAGDDFRPLAVLPGASVGALICQESYLPNAPRAMTRLGAQLLATSTSDGTFGSSVIVFEHLVTTQVRALETGRDIVWSSNAGPSGLIDRWGRLVTMGPFRETAAVRMTAALYDDLPFYLRTSAWWTVASVLIFVTLLIQHLARGVAAAAPPAEPPRVPHRGPRFVAATLASVVVSLAIWGFSPALVEARRGQTRRMLAAVPDLFADVRFVETREGQQRLRTDGEHSAAGAVAYFLTYYGMESAAATVALSLPASPNLDEVRNYLEATLDVRTRLFRIDDTHLPRVATLVRLRTGAYGVVTWPSGEGPPSLFLSTTGQAELHDKKHLIESIEQRGIIPMTR